MRLTSDCYLSKLSNLCKYMFKPYTFTKGFLSLEAYGFDTILPEKCVIQLFGINPLTCNPVKRKKKRNKIKV